MSNLRRHACFVTTNALELLSRTTFWSLFLRPLLHFFVSGTQTQTTSSKEEAMKNYTPIMGH